MPDAVLVQDDTGTFYGTTKSGGFPDSGTAFKLTPDGSGGFNHTVILNFYSVGINGRSGCSGLIRAACGSLDAFINAVEAQRGNKITNAQADDLIAQAQAICALIGCN